MGRVRRGGAYQRKGRISDSCCRCEAKSIYRESGPWSLVSEKGEKSAFLALNRAGVIEVGM